MSDDGRREAARQGSHLASLGISKIVTSNMRRAVETARIYADQLGVTYEPTAAFTELDHGEWEGRRIAGLLADPSSGYAKWMRDPSTVSIPNGTESVRDAQLRAVRGISELISRSPETAILVISHKHLLALLMCALQRHPLSMFSAMIRESTEAQRLPEALLGPLAGSHNP